MNKFTILFCRVILLLDWIPRYGRVYGYDPRTRRFTNKRWIYFKPRHGLWGFYLLDRLGLLHKYLSTLPWKEVPRPEDKT